MYLKRVTVDKNNVIFLALLPNSGSHNSLSLSLCRALLIQKVKITLVSILEELFLSSLICQMSWGLRERLQGMLWTTFVKCAKCMCRLPYLSHLYRDGLFPLIKTRDEDWNVTWVGLFFHDILIVLLITQLQNKKIGFLSVRCHQRIWHSFTLLLLSRFCAPL